MRRTLTALVAAALLAAGCSSDDPAPAATTGGATDLTPGVRNSTDAPDGPGTSTDEPSATGTDGTGTPGRPAFEPEDPDRGTDRDDPLEIGEFHVIADEWAVAIVAYDPDATQAVLDHNPQNAPPPDGEVFALARLEATFLGEGSANAFLELEWALVDEAGVLHTDADCGVLPDDLAEQSSVPSGQSASGTICFSTDEDVLDEVVLFVNRLLGEEPTQRWWSAPRTPTGELFAS